MSEEPTIRTAMSRVIQDQAAPTPLRELALEVLHWRLRDRIAGFEADATVRIRATE